EHALEGRDRRRRRREGVRRRRPQERRRLHCARGHRRAAEALRRPDRRSHRAGREAAARGQSGGRPSAPLMDGVLVVDKPAGPTSHDIVARARRLVGEPRVGHTGTLDPAASGVLPLVMGRATRLARFFAAAEKSYEAIIRLGYATDTDDAEGVPGPVSPGPLPGRADIEEALAAFRGAFE